MVVKILMPYKKYIKTMTTDNATKRCLSWKNNQGDNTRKSIS